MSVVQAGADSRTPTPAARAGPPDGREGTFPRSLEQLLERRSLATAEAERLMDGILQGALGPERLAALVTALRAKGVAADELVGFALSMRRHAAPLDAGPGPFLDTCGTGGSPTKAFNVSTAVAFVLATAGVRVAKHGNRSVTRPSGSADVLEAAGARLDLGPEAVGAVLRSQGIAFLFAPTFHPAMRHAAPVRKALGIRTVFNLLGPLANPAGATQHVLGVHDPTLVQPMAEALARLGVRSGFVLHGHVDGQPDAGYDEAMPTGAVRFIPIVDGRPGPAETLDPTDLGLPRVTPLALAPLPPAEAADLLRAILSGRQAGPRADAVALNAAFGLVAAGRAATLAEGLAQARALLASGSALAVLDGYVSATQDARRTSANAEVTLGPAPGRVP